MVYATNVCFTVSMYTGHPHVFNVTCFFNSFDEGCAYGLLVFLRVTLKTREWPGDEASLNEYSPV